MGRRSRKKNHKLYHGIVGWLPLKVFLFILKILPVKCLYCFGEKLSQFIFTTLKKRRDISMGNLRLAFGKEKTEEEIRKIYRSTIRNIGRGGVEILAYPRFCDGYFNDMISIDGKENLDEALKRGKGVIAVSAHFGNFPFLATKIASLGYPISVIFRHPHQRGLAQYFEDQLNLSGVEPIPDKPRKSCVAKSLKCLKRNEILLLLMDMNAGSGGGVYVDFFGWMVPTFKGPIVLALRTGAAVLPVFIVREAGDRHRIIIDPPMDLKLIGDKDKNIFTNLSRLSKIVESHIREYPDQWWWIHRRWRKAKPNES